MNVNLDYESFPGPWRYANYAHQVLQRMAVVQRGRQMSARDAEQALLRIEQCHREQLRQLPSSSKHGFYTGSKVWV